MISNAVANSPASSGPVRSGGAGRTSGESDNAFRKALDESTKAASDESGKETESAETRPRTALADTRWQSTLENAPEEQPTDGEAKGEVSGEQLLKDAKSQMQDAASDAAGKNLPHNVVVDQTGGDETQAQPDNIEGSELAADQAVQTAGVAAKAVSQNAANGIARAGEVASENARPPGRSLSGNGQPVTDAGSGDISAETVTNLAGKGLGDAQPANSDRGVRNAPVAGQAPGQSTAASSRPDPQAAQVAGTRGDQGQHTDTGLRVTGDIKADTGRIAADTATLAAKPSAETAGATVRTAASADVLPGTADGSVSRQVADAVARELEELAPSRLSLAGSTAQGGKTVKTMRMQLHPAELGAVNIRMQSVNGELRVTIQADSDQTSRMLHNDSDAIRSALRAAGINGADVIVANHRNDSAQPQNFSAQHRDPSGQQAGAHENRQNAANESRQSNRESSSNDSTQTRTRGGDAGNNGNVRGNRITI